MAREITKATVKTLRPLAAVYFPDDETYRARLWKAYGVRSTLDLSDKQGKELIAEIREGLGHTGKASRKYPDHPSGRKHYAQRYAGKGRKGYASRLTWKQAVKIGQLEDQLGWTPQPNRLTGFAARTLRLEHPKLISALTKAEATDLITALSRFASARSAVEALDPSS